MSLLDEIKRKSNVPFRRASAPDVEGLRSIGVPEDAISFYQESEPAVVAEINKVRLWPIAEIVRENKENVPGAFIQPWGFVVFATSIYGDAFCFDTRDANSHATAAVVLVAHDLDWEDAETRTGLGGLAKAIAPSFQGFLEQFATETLDIEPLYPKFP